jgi:hypothetical protein
VTEFPQLIQFNIKIDIHEMERGGMDWVDLVQDRDRWRVLVNAVMSLRAL